MESYIGLCFLLARRLEFPLLDKIVHFGRQNKGASVISYVKIGHDLRGPGGLIFLNEVTTVRKNL